MRCRCRRRSRWRIERGLNSRGEHLPTQYFTRRKRAATARPRNRLASPIYIWLARFNEETRGPDKIHGGDLSAQERWSTFTPWITSNVSRAWPFRFLHGPEDLIGGLCWTENLGAILYVCVWIRLMFIINRAIHTKIYFSFNFQGISKYYNWFSL